VQNEQPYLKEQCQSDFQGYTEKVNLKEITGIS